MTGQQERFYAFANGIKLHYIEFGSGELAVLVIPGITSPAITWSFIAKRLASFAHVYVLDVRGRGLSDHRPGLSYMLDDYAADADGLLESIGVPSAAVLGHSMGARIGIRMAVRHPKRVGRLLLVDPPMGGPGRRTYPTPLQFYLDDIDAAEQGKAINTPSHWTEEQAKIRSEWLPTCSVESVAESYRGFHEEDIHANFPSINCPTLMLCAEEGGVVTGEDVDEISKLNPSIRTRRMSGVGHMIPWDDLDQFVSSVEEFIAETPTV